MRLDARVTRVFDDASMEVCVNVGASNVTSESNTPINSGYLTVGLVDQRTGRPIRLQPSQPPTADEADEAATAQHDAAILRRRLRVQRRQMFSLRADAMHYSPTLLKELKICNIMGLLRVAHSTAVEWQTRLTIGANQPLSRAARRGTLLPNALAPAPITVSLSRDTLGTGTSAMKVEVLVHAPVEEVFAAVSDYTKRVEWDSLMARGHVHAQLDAQSSINYLVMKPLARGMQSHDYALLQSWQKDDKDGYVVASRSVIHDDLPPVAGLSRGAVLPSGFLLDAIDAQTNQPVSPTRAGASTRLIYVAQMALAKGITGQTFGDRIIDAIAQKLVRRFVRLQCVLGRSDDSKAVASSASMQLEVGAPSKV